MEVYPFTTWERILTPLKYYVFENILENRAFAPMEQLLHFPYFQKYSKLKTLH